MARIVVTGAAGFTRLHLCRRLPTRGDEVFRVDSLDDHYDVGLNEARRARLQEQPGFWE